MKKHPFKVTFAYFPTPCVLVVSGDMDEANIITIAWSGVVNSDPPLVGVSLRAATHSFNLIRKYGEFTVNVPGEEMVRQVDICGTVSGTDIDKFSYTGLTKVAAMRVRPPLVGEALLNIECKVRREIELGSHTQFIGEIIEVHVDETIVDADGRVSLGKAPPLLYCPVVHEYRLVGKKLGRYGYSKGKLHD